MNNKLIQRITSHFLEHKNFHGKNLLKSGIFRFNVGSGSVFFSSIKDPELHQADTDPHNWISGQLSYAFLKHYSSWIWCTSAASSRGTGPRSRCTALTSCTGTTPFSQEVWSSPQLDILPNPYFLKSWFSSPKFLSDYHLPHLFFLLKSLNTTGKMILLPLSPFYFRTPLSLTKNTKCTV